MSNFKTTNALLFLAMAFFTCGCGSDNTAGPRAAQTILVAAFEEDVENASLFSGISRTDKAITFTPESSGTMDRVDVFLSGGSSGTSDLRTLVVDIRETVSGIPVNDDTDIVSITAYAELDTISGARWISVTGFTPAARLEAGITYGLALRSSDSWTWLGKAGDPDPASASFFRNPNANINTWSATGGDLFYRVYLVPE